ncbi:uncharacterized protein BT62DRAFT_919424 [Guyanagaster necrorhizus]|uniref:Transmembrane protein n=1 Tax=Guyanagaster necrorhizus TaxID=856835 RepID=A0A9P7VUH3_9AGAR|nr:uncharacterized protein BT62DRAFT_919424 [Guyanagaster necrorhizus MCA 3950]KAG7446858.1 hypothetical protein BT62DRAFT_919424 [Guyanagaster necrorhizus MCA 3950]
MTEIAIEDERDSKQPPESKSEEDADENPPPPTQSSRLKRIAFLIFVGFFFWLAYAARQRHLARQKKIVYATRYSNEFKFRPAASPIITETLKGGGTRLRGANPTATSRTTPTPTPEKKRRRRRSKRNAQAMAKAANK